MRSLNFLFVLFTSFFSTTGYAVNWAEAIPPNFSHLERFFSNSNCVPILGVSYIYNVDTGEWLSLEQAKSLYPDTELYFALQSPRKSEDGDCKISATKAELMRVFGINLMEASGNVLFFFDSMFTKEGKRFPFHADHDKKMIKRFERVSLFNGLPKYHVKVNTVGLKPQKM